MSNKVPILELRDIGAQYENTKVLHGVNLTVYENDFLGIIGPNGGGKTTLIKVILGLKKPNEGTLQFYKNRETTPSLTIGYLPQYNTIDKKFPISVREVILSGLNGQKRVWKRFTDEQHQQVSQTIARMGLIGMEDKPIGVLSGGQLQRVLLGRALVSSPTLLLLDEPNTYIDKYHEAKLYNLLEEINHECAIILVSHDIGTVLQNVKSIACVNETLHYHPDTDFDSEWLETHFGCPIELVGHGHLPHRVLKKHHH